MGIDERTGLERRRVRYSGRVQGVGFRAAALYAGRRCAVTGWVRNEDDGCGLPEVQGDAAEITAVLRDLRQQMERNIRSEDVAVVPVESGEREFEVRR